MKDDSSRQTNAGYETTDISPQPIVVLAVGGVVVSLLFAVFVWFFIDFSAARQSADSPSANPLASTFARREPPEPRLQPHPLRDLQSLRARERETLTTYGWVDRNAGVVRIPIEQAKELIAKRGVGALGGGQ